MSIADNSPRTDDRRGLKLSRLDALTDIALYLLIAAAFWFAEEGLRALGLYPYAGLADGALSLVLSLFVVMGINRKRGGSSADLGLKRPARWWTIPLWGFLVLLVNIILQITVVPLLAKLLGLPALDLSKYDALQGNLPLAIGAGLGAMFTGGFIEEVIYRGFIMGRLIPLFGGGKRAPLLAGLACGIPFGLIHFQWGLGGMFVTAVMGSALGLMFLATKRNLWPLIAAHATLDMILMIQVYFLGTNFG